MTNGNLTNRLTNKVENVAAFIFVLYITLLTRSYFDLSLIASILVYIAASTVANIVVAAVRIRFLLKSNDDNNKNND